MFITRIEQEISPGRTEDYARYQEQSVAAVMGQPGFLWDIRMMFLGKTMPGASPTRRGGAKKPDCRTHVELAGSGFRKPCL